MALIAFKNILNNLSNKFLAIIFGIAIWYIATEHRLYEKTVTVPICFYNLKETSRLNAPETISVTLAGTRRELQALRPEDCALHLDAQKFTRPITYKIINSVDFFVPESVRVVHCTPSYVEIKQAGS